MLPLLALVLATAGPAEMWSPPNLVQNPGFETANAAGSPAEWADFAVVDDVAHSGTHSLFYENTDPQVYRLSGQPIPLEPGKAYEVSVWVRTEGVKGTDNGATICLEWYDADGNYIGGHYPRGVKGDNDWRQITSRCGRVPEGATRCSVTCYLRKGCTGKAWWDDVEVRQYRQPPLQTLLTVPNYRGIVTPDVKRVELLAALELDDWNVSLDESRLRVEIVDETGSVERSKLVRPEADKLTLRLPARGLSPGPYEARVAVMVGEDEIGEQSWRLTVTDEPLSGRPSYVDEHNRLIRDGKPFFPLGMYWSGVGEEDLKIYSDSAFNCLMPYGAPDDEKMDLIDRYGLKVIYSVKDIYAGHVYQPEDIETVGDERAFIEDKVERYRDHPALLAWYLNDELPVSFMPQLEAHQQWLEELDPGHPTWVVLYQVSELEHYVRTFDAIGSDPYPIPSDSARRAGRWTQMTVDAVHNRRPVWQVPQVFNWANYRKTEEEKQGLRPPTLSEMRSMTWQCIAHGAKGLIYYSWFDIKRDTVVPFEEQWGYVKQVAAEVDEMVPVILSVEPVPEITARERDWLHWTARRVGRDVHLIAVNDDDRGHTARFQLPSEPKSVMRRDGSAVEAPRDRRLEVELEPHGVEIYVMRLGDGRSQ